MATWGQRLKSQTSIFQTWHHQGPCSTISLSFSLIHCRWKKKWHTDCGPLEVSPLQQSKSSLNFRDTVRSRGFATENQHKVELRVIRPTTFLSPLNYQVSPRPTTFWFWVLEHGNKVSPRFPYSGLLGNYLWATGLSVEAYLHYRNTKNIQLEVGLLLVELQCSMPVHVDAECKSTASWLPQSLQVQHGLLRKGYTGFA